MQKKQGSKTRFQTLESGERNSASPSFLRSTDLPCVGTDDGGARKHRICGAFWNAFNSSLACLRLLMAPGRSQLALSVTNSWRKVRRSSKCDLRQPPPALEHSGGVSFTRYPPKYSPGITQLSHQYYIGITRVSPGCIVCSGGQASAHTRSFDRLPAERCCPPHYIRMEAGK